MSIQDKIVKTFEQANGHLFNPPLADEIRLKIVVILAAINTDLASACVEGKFQIEDLKHDKCGSLIYFVTDRHYTDTGYKPNKEQPKSRFECCGFEVFSDKLEFLNSRMIGSRHKLERNDKDGLIKKIEDKLSYELDFYLSNEDKIKLRAYLVSQIKAEARPTPAP